MTIYIIGDSTVENNKPPFRGWGWAIPEFVKEGVEVNNCALSGRSSRSFKAEGLFKPVEDGIKAGDMLLIQFGHNDEKPDAERATDPETTFRDFLWEYCSYAIDRGAIPVLITPVERRFFTADGGLMYTHGEYPLAVRNLAKMRGVPLIDLHAESRRLYLEKGADETAKLFVQIAPGENPDFPDGHDDKTHFNAEGAKVMAAIVAEGLKKYPECAKFMK